jgi:hypothetical protein
LEGIEKKEESNSPKYTYRIRFTLPGGEEDVVFIHADHYEYDPVCVSFIEYHPEFGDPIIMSSIKNWFCIERKDYDEDEREDSMNDLRDIFARLDEVFSKYENKGD